MKTHSLVSLALASAFVSIVVTPGRAQTLEAFAQLPANSFAPGPTSGQFITPANGVVPPFPGAQPIQGFSSVLIARDGDVLVMCDNGFGQKNNSQDYVLRVYRIAADPRTRWGGAGTVDIRGFISLRDPDHKINFPIVADLDFYPDNPGNPIPVDEGIRKHRWLTGGDFDIESFREAPDGTLWFGDEFGPFLIHTDRTGKVLEAPYPLPGVMSPQSPFLGTSTPNLPRSKGFEGMAIGSDGRSLYPMLEGPLTTDEDQRRLIIYQFDLRKREYTNKRWFYRLEADSATGQAIGDLTLVERKRFLVIERDNAEGAAAAFKKIFLVDLNDVDEDGFLVKREVADLLNVQDPHGLFGSDPVFRFPFQTIESVIPLGPRHLGVLDDNNYPFSNGRVPGTPDPNELILIRLDEPLYR